MSNLVAVLTGDLIGSTKADLGRVERSMTILAQAAEFIERETKNRSTRFSRSYGDGWQMYLDHPGDSLWIAVYLNALLKADPHSLPTRIAIGIGEVESLGATGLAGARGSAFTSSVRTLVAMQPGQTLALEGDPTDDMQRVAVAFIEERMSGWSREQAEVMKLKLVFMEPNLDEITTHLVRRLDLTQGEIASQFEITRQAVGARLQAAGYKVINRACYVFRECFEPKEAP